MNQCKSCGYENADVNKFCEKCGTKLETNVTPKFCRNCGKETVPGTKFCTGCGKPLQPMAEAGQAGKQVKISATATKNKEQLNAPVKEKKKTWIILLIAGIVLVVALIVGIVFVMSGISGGNDREDAEIESYSEEKKSGDIEDEIETDVKEPKTVEQDTEAKATEENGQVDTNVDYTAPIPLQATVTASSSLQEESYAASALTDGNANTAWGEGAAGLGNGEYLIYRFDEEKDVFGIAILPGNLNSVGDFYRYACPTELLVIAGDKSQSVKITNFSANIKEQTNPYLYLELEEPVHTGEIMISIADAREGTEIETTCISEMHPYTYPSLESKEAFSVDAWKVAYTEQSDYILPESNSRYLDISDLEGLTADECRLARNELYARHGRKFDDESLRAYFESKEWYEGTIDAKDFDESVLNEYEFANRDLIVEYEKEQGYR